MLHGDLVCVLYANYLVHSVTKSDQLLTSFVQLILRQRKFDDRLKMKLPPIFFPESIDYFLLLRRPFEFGSHRASLLLFLNLIFFLDIWQFKVIIVAVVQWHLPDASEEDFVIMRDF